MENFILKFEYKGKPHILEVRPWMQQYKAVYRVTVEKHELTFEQDEEGDLRAVSDVHSVPGHIDPGLLEEVAQRIVAHVNEQG